MTVDATLRATPPLYGCPPTLLGGALDSSSLPLTFETSPRAWNYTLSFKRADAQEGTTGAIVVRVTMDVLAGMVGVGVLKGDGPQFLDEVVLGVGAHGVADVLVGDCAAAGDLMVRNASPEGKSRGRILAIESFTVQVDVSGDREPGLSFPKPTPRWSRYFGTDLPTPVEKLRAQTFAALTVPEVVRWRDGLSFRAVPNDQMSRAVYVSGTYEPNTLAVLQRVVRPGDVFLDVGANSGLFTLVASRYVGEHGHVYSFEPSEREYRRLCDTIQLNELDRIVTPLQSAVGAKTGHEMLRVASEPYTGLNTLGSRFPYDGVDVSSLERVDVTTLDDFSQRQAVSRIDVVKIDVEGAEAAVLAGAAGVLLRHRPALIIEVFSRSLALNGASVSELQQCLRTAEYRQFRIDDETAELTPLDDLTSVDEQNIVAFPAEKT